MYADVPEGFSVLPDFSSLEKSNGLPAGALDAVWKQESNRGKSLVGPKTKYGTAKGHFQFIDSTAKEYGLEDPNDLNQSAEAAARYLGDLTKKYGGDFNKALAAYNWGPGNVDKKGIEKAPSETRNYVANISRSLSNTNALELPTNQYSDIPEGFQVYSDVPDGFSVQNSESYSPETVQNPEDGFLDRVKEDFNKRAKLAGEIQGETEAGRQTKAEQIFQTAGKVGAGLVNDITGEALKSAGSYTSDLTPDFIEEPIKEGLRSVGKSISESQLGQIMGDVGGEAITAYQDFAKNHPRAARNIESAINIGLTIGLPGKTGQAAGTAITETADIAKDAAFGVAKTGIKAAKVPVKSVAKGIQNIAEGVAARGPEELDEVTKVLKSNASSLYKKSRDLGAVLNKNRAVGLTNAVENEIKKDTILNKRLHGDTMAILKEFKQVSRQKPLGLEELDQYRNLFSGVASKNFLSNPQDARLASIAIDKIDDIVENLKPIDIIGGKTEAIDALNAGRSEWKRFKKFETVSDIIKKAEGDPNKIKSGLKTLVNNKKKIRGFSSEELKALREASRASIPEKIFKGLGRFGFDPGNVFLPVVGGGVAGFGFGAPAGIALTTAGTGARQVQKYLGRGKAEKALKVIEGR